MAAASRTLRHARHLSDIEGRLEGSVRRSGRDRLKSSWCPCCGHRKKKHHRSFVVTQGRDGLLFKCFRCDASFEQIAQAFEQATGIVLGGFRTEVIDNGNLGPFDAEVEVLKLIDPDRRTSVGSFGLDETGRRATRIVACTVSARQRCPRLRHDPWTCPFAVDFVHKVAFKLGWEITRYQAWLIARRIARLAGGTHFHYLVKRLQVKRGYRALRVHLVSFSLKRTALASDFRPPAPDSAASSGSERSSVKSGLERFLGDATGNHGPPEPAEPSEQPTDERTPEPGRVKPSLYDLIERARQAWERLPVAEAV